MEQLHSKTPARASSGWSWSWLDGVFGMKVIPSSRKGDFEGELSFLPLVHGTHMSYSLALSLFAERPLELLSSCELYPSPLSSFSYRWAIPNHKQAEGHRRRPPLDAGEEGDGCCCSGGGIDPIKDANRRMPLPPDGAT